VNHGVWTEAILRPVQRLTLQASLRSDMNPDYGLHWSPGLGLAWQLLPGLKLRGSAGTGFRAPTLSDRYWPLSGVRELEPERGWAAQIGTDAYSEKFDFSATGFLRRVREMISWLPDTGLIWRPTNVDEVRIGGLELSGRIRPYPGLEFGFAVTGLEGSQIRQEQINWAVPEFVRAERFPASLPSLRVNLSARHEFRFGLHLGARARICDERFNYYPEFGLDSLIVVRVKRLAPYSVLDLELGQTLFREFRLVLRAENLLDAKYAEQFGTSRSDRDYPMPGRTFSLAIRFEHGR
jgi:outer membrane receptor protein involved in Fe transport